MLFALFTSINKRQLLYYFQVCEEKLRENFPKFFPPKKQALLYTILHPMIYCRANVTTFSKKRYFKFPLNHSQNVYIIQSHIDFIFIINTRVIDFEVHKRHCVYLFTVALSILFTFSFRVWMWKHQLSTIRTTTIITFHCRQISKKKSKFAFIIANHTWFNINNSQFQKKKQISVPDKCVLMLTLRKYKCVEKSYKKFQ